MDVINQVPCKRRRDHTWPLVSNASQSAVPVGSRPIDRHFHSPTDSVSILHATYTNFCKPSVFNAVALDDVGASGANTTPEC